MRKSDSSFNNRILAIYTLLFSFEMFHGCLKWFGAFSSRYFVHFAETNALTWLSFGPLVFLYVRKAITNHKLKVVDILLFTPTFLVFLLYLPFYFKNTNVKIDIIANHRVYDVVLLPSYGIWLIILIMTLFGILTILKYKDFNKLGFNQALWLKWFVGSYLGFVFFFFLYVFLVRFDLMSYKYDYFIDGIILLFIGSLAYFGFVQPDIFEGKKQLKEVIPFTKYRKSGLSKNVSLDLKNKLEGILEKEKIYLNNELRLNDVAELLNISRNQASQIINQHYNLSFFDFINKLRVEESLKMLLNNEDDNLNITQIAYSVGFNNRSSFYKAFKKFTNESPSSYLSHSQAS
ncbi:MAG: helix-turn-helix transcriptional regulator [Flavobacteriaceae bacterium]|nr:helix-turn-helix transcriptional regulator [Flavobacteriaceae bacterium]